MMSPDDWNGRTVDIEFQAEDVGDDAMMHRKFTNISKGATKRQILQFGKAVSSVTPNGADGDIQANVHDRFILFDDDDDSDGNQ